MHSTSLSALRRAGAPCKPLGAAGAAGAPRPAHRAVANAVQRTSPAAPHGRQPTACNASVSERGAQTPITPPPPLCAQAAAPPQLADAPAAAEGEDMSVEELKAALMDTLWGTQRGLAADGDTRAEVAELLGRLEAANPTPAPAEALERLDGAWALAYTANSELLALLALGRLPLLEVGAITQRVDAAARTVENVIELSGPLVSTRLAATAALEARSPQLLGVRFTEGRVATPRLDVDFSLPESVEALGQRVDLGPLRAALAPLEGPARAARDALAGLLADAPDLTFPIGGASPLGGGGGGASSASSWLLTTYLDDDLRVARGDGGSIFVLTRERIALVPVAAADAWEPMPPVTEEEAALGAAAAEGNGLNN
jgi:hypothetical protein